jgi:alpha-beta hydrolase superfamily lysophospholipase
MKKKLFFILKVLIGLYVLLCVVMFFAQENFIFFPEKLDDDYQYEFNQDFEEIQIKTKDNHQLNGLLFKANHSKGLIFYLHGNAGSLKSWGIVAKTYTNLNYDVFILDYRGFGKSTGEIINEKQLFDDNQSAYNILKQDYKEKNIIILGYSIGTGMASKLASENNPKMLILQAPYYSLTDMMKQNFPFLPTFILKYQFKTNEYLSNCNIPIVIFHGNKDEVINYDASIRLKKEFNSKIKIITLKNQGHNQITDNAQYQKELEKILK